MGKLPWAGTRGVGPLFFGSIQAFNSKFDVKNDPENVVIDFIEYQNDVTASAHSYSVGSHSGPSRWHKA